jgi:CIC family chloride channel protein
MRALGQDGNLTVLDTGSSDLIVAFPDELLSHAVTKMLRNNIGHLPVVNRKDPLHLIGYLERSNILEARLRQLNDEHVREHGWFHNLFLKIMAR